VTRHEISQAPDGERLATLTTACFARDCGSAGEPQTPLHAMPARSPDQLISYVIREDAAQLYRLTGDRNPLHVDPAAAARAGFECPIPHGLCTLGMTCRAIIESVVGWQAHRVASHEARFSAPVYPGETLEIALWCDSDVVSFEASIPDRQIKVLTSGRSQLNPK
jgi:acyl dehydratase